MEMFDINDFSQTAEFSQVSKNFESSGWLKKIFLKFNDEYASDSTNQINRNVLSVVKRLTGGDKIRIEQKYGEITQKILNPVITVTMNYKHSFNTITDFVSLYRRLIVFNLNFFINKEEKKLSFLDSLPKEEFSNLFIIFSLNVSESKIDNCIPDLIILKHQDINNLKLTDSFLSYTYLKLFSNKNSHVSIFLLVASYVSFVIYEYDTSIPINDEKSLKYWITKVFENPYEEYYFDCLQKHLKSMTGFFSSLDVLSHLNFFQRSHFYSFFETLFSRLIFLGEKFNINTIEYSSCYKTVGVWEKGNQIGVKKNRIPIIKGISINVLEEFFMSSKKNITLSTQLETKSINKEIIEKEIDFIEINSINKEIIEKEKITTKVVTKVVLPKDLFLQQKKDILLLLKDNIPYEKIFIKYPQINKKTIWNWKSKIK